MRVRECSFSDIQKGGFAYFLMQSGKMLKIRGLDMVVKFCLTKSGKRMYKYYSVL